MTIRSLVVKAAVLTLAACGLPFVAAAPARAGTVYTWTGAADNVFDNQLNWSPSTGVPANGDTAIVGKAGTYTLTFNGSRSIDTILLGDDDAHVTLELDNSAILGVNSAMTIAAGSALHLQHTSGTDGPVVSVAGNGGTVTNDGTVVSDSNAPTNTNTWAPKLVNHGTFTLHSGRFSTIGDVQNSGTITAGTGTYLYDGAAGSDHTFTNTGTLVNDGGFNLQSTKVAWNGGTTTGTPISVSSAGFADSGGTGTFLLYNSTHFTGTIGAGQTFIAGGGPGPDHTLIFDAPSTIAAGGLLKTVIPDTSYFNLSGEPLTNNGTIDVTVTNTTTRPLGLAPQIALTNNGTINVHSGDLWDQTTGSITNHGVISVDPGARVFLEKSTPGPALTNASDGTLRFGLAGPASFGVVGGPATMTPGGTVDVTLVGGYVPAAGASFPVISVAHTAGTFAGIPAGFTVAYAASTISLVRSGATTPPTPAPAPSLGPARISTTGKVTVTITAPKPFGDSTHPVKVVLTLTTPGLLTKKARHPKPVVLATKTITLTTGKKISLTFTLGAKAKAFLAAHPGAKVTLVAVSQQAGHTDVRRTHAVSRPARFV